MGWGGEGGAAQDGFSGVPRHPAAPGDKGGLARPGAGSQRFRGADTDGAALFISNPARAPPGEESHRLPHASLAPRGLT